MKKYQIFAFDQYYPSGGYDDLVDELDTEGEVIKFLRKTKREESFTFGGFQVVFYEDGKRRIVKGSFDDEIPDSLQ